MTLSTRAAAHLAVLGAALLAAAVWPLRSTADASTANATTVTPRPPAVAVAVTVARHPARPAARTRRRPVPTRPARHVAPRVPARASTRDAARQPAPPAARSSRPHRAAGPTTWAALNAAIAQIPSYRAGAARWVVSNRYGHWGTADWYHGVIYIAPSVPSSLLYDVAVHEWSHELSVLDYGGDVDAAVRAMDGLFGGSGLVGAERAADCMAIAQGATWTHYTSCQDRRWRAGAARLVRGGRL